MSPTLARNLLRFATPGLADYRHPIGFSELEAWDSMVNVKSMALRIFFPDVGSGGTGALSISRRKGDSRTGRLGDILHTATGGNVFQIDWADTRLDRGGKVGAPWYYPRVKVLGYANGVQVSLEPFAGGDGQVSTAVDWEGASKSFDVTAFCDGVGTIYGTLMLIVTIKERFDSLALRSLGSGRWRILNINMNTVLPWRNLQPIAFSKEDITTVRVGETPCDQWKIVTQQDDGTEAIEFTVNPIAHGPVSILTATGEVWVMRDPVGAPRP